MITQVRLKQMLRYDLPTGVFVWISPPVKCQRFIGREAGRINNNRRSIKIDGRSYYAHRLAFLYMLGWIPEMIDHANRDSLDNRWVNLRAADRRENRANAKVSRNNNSGYKGVCKSGTGWRAQTYSRGQQFYLGTFKTKSDASRAYTERAQRLFGEFATTGEIK